MLIGLDATENLKRATLPLAHVRATNLAPQPACRPRRPEKCERFQCFCSGRFAEMEAQRGGAVFNEPLQCLFVHVERRARLEMAGRTGRRCGRQVRRRHRGSLVGGSLPQPGDVSGRSSSSVEAAVSDAAPATEPLPKDTGERGRLRDGRSPRGASSLHAAHPSPAPSLPRRSSCRTVPPSMCRAL